MVLEIGSVVATTVIKIAPFMPFLIGLGQAGAKKLAEMTAEAGGKAAWDKAKALWTKINAYFGNDPEVQSAAKLLAAKPEDETRQTMLATVLGDALKDKPELAQEIFDLLGGQKVVQEVIAERSSWVENVTQKLKATGNQTVRASDHSTIRGVSQEGQT